MSGHAQDAGGGGTLKQAVVIGGSTGATLVVCDILAALPAGFRTPVLVVQHRHPDARTGLAELLQQHCALPVWDAEEKQPLEPGVYVAPANYHLLVGADGTLSLCAGERVQHARPSVDVTFESAVDAFGGALVGVILTGANRDGAAGLALIHAAGGETIVQAPASAEAPSMPQAAVAVTPSANVKLPAEIGPMIIRLCEGDVGGLTA